jgi:uncharacterized protein (TIGR03118 family)
MRSFLALALGLITIAAIAAPLIAQTNGSYTQTNLVSDTAGMAPHVDPKLVNPWGIAFFPGDPFWISDNNSGFSTLYDASGNVQSLVVTVPPPAGIGGTSTPTGIVINGTTGFQVTSGGATAPSQFIFDTEDGTISGWNGNGTQAALVVDNSMGGNGAVYKGLAMITNSTGTFLLAANFRSATVDVFDSNFKSATLAGNFADPTLPAGFAPFGIHVINSQVVVTYAMQDQPKHDPVNAAGNGYVSLFDLDGNFIRRIASQGNLNSPWGAVTAPAGFGAFSNDLLVGNFGDGTINAFDFNSGDLIGQMQDSNAMPIVNLSLWDMVFGAGGEGSPTTLYFTAGLADEAHGLFGTITANASAPAPTPDFSIATSAAAATVGPGKPASLTVTLGGMNGFDSAIMLSCSQLPALTTCSFSPASVTPQSGGNVTSMVTVSTTATGYMPAIRSRGMSSMAKLASCGAFGLVGLMWMAAAGSTQGDRKNTLRNVLGRLGIFVVLVVALVAVGCGGYKSPTSTSATPGGQTTMMINAVSGNLTHSIPVTLTVN